VIEPSVRRAYPEDIAQDINEPYLPLLIRRFIARTLRSEPENSADSSSNISDLSESSLPLFVNRISIYHSAVAQFYAPSDICGVKGMRCERIHASPSWHKGAPRYDTILVETDADQPGMRGLDVAQVRIFFSFQYNGAEYRCAFVDWFSRVGDQPDEDTGTWVVERDHDINDQQISEVIHIDTIIRCSHLIGVYGAEPVSIDLKFSDSLYAFHTYYVNRYADHHSYEVTV
jgi:hypothetical protein